jgi:hypothetical protein
MTCAGCAVADGIACAGCVPAGVVLLVRIVGVPGVSA